MQYSSVRYTYSIVQNTNLDKLWLSWTVHCCFTLSRNCAIILSVSFYRLSLKFRRNILESSGSVMFNKVLHMDSSSSHHKEARGLGQPTCQLTSNYVRHPGLSCDWSTFHRLTWQKNMWMHMLDIKLTKLSLIFYGELSFTCSLWAFYTTRISLRAAVRLYIFTA